jgi:hypothetical protein
MSDFKKWWETHRHEWELTDEEEGLAILAAEYAWAEQKATIDALNKVVEAGAELEKEVYAYMEYTKLPDNIMSLCCNFTKALAELQDNE